MLARTAEDIVGAQNVVNMPSTAYGTIGNAPNSSFLFLSRRTGMYINSSLVEARQELSGPEVPDTKTAVYQLLAIGLFWILSKIPTLWAYLQLLFNIPPEWPMRVFPSLNSYIKSHPYSCLSYASIVFFGPMTFAIPPVVLQDLTVHILLNLTYLSHGMASDRPLARYYHSSSSTYVLAFAPAICRFEVVFSWLENAASVYNQWTTNHMPLIILRLLAAALSVYIVLGLLWLWT
ncbi:hypothetical protein E1B28_011981 [Marasmius oreades]|uniref:Uncharacterized protein n=1 Tax=Marasmius oreades TaxID=181124 RepID=A0A9P7RRH6_9AGAR|nr:uncharacterized protein E1B28_011981 [Marasmius oreades]KAG7087936.1 hypothetical protein E1B28_011981 [Marasmius oreades]